MLQAFNCIPPQCFKNGLIWHSSHCASLVITINSSVESEKGKRMKRKLKFEIVKKSPQLCLKAIFANWVNSVENGCEDSNEKDLYLQLQALVCKAKILEVIKFSERRNVMKRCSNILVIHYISGFLIIHSWLFSWVLSVSFLLNTFMKVRLQFESRESSEPFQHTIKWFSFICDSLLSTWKVLRMKKSKWGSLVPPSTAIKIPKLQPIKVKFLINFQPFDCKNLHDTERKSDKENVFPFYIFNTFRNNWSVVLFITRRRNFVHLPKCEELLGFYRVYWFWGVRVRVYQGTAIFTVDRRTNVLGSLWACFNNKENYSTFDVWVTTRSQSLPRTFWKDNRVPTIRTYKGDCHAILYRIRHLQRWSWNCWNLPTGSWV